MAGKFWTIPDAVPVLAGNFLHTNTMEFATNPANNEMLTPGSDVPSHWGMSKDVKLRDYQAEGVNFFIGLRDAGLNGILADEVFKCQQQAHNDM